MVDYYRLFPVGASVEWRHCPIYLIEDGQQFGIPIGSSLFVLSIPQIQETRQFLRMLGGLTNREQNEWRKTRDKLAISTRLTGLDFKLWSAGPKVTFSTRVNRELRAHVRFDSGTKTWTAEAIGHHKEMGHD
jgi:hypothetical protein